MLLIVVQMDIAIEERAIANQVGQESHVTRAYPVPTAATVINVSRERANANILFRVSIARTWEMKTCAPFEVFSQQKSENVFVFQDFRVFIAKNELALKTVQIEDLVEQTANVFALKVTRARLVN